MQLHIIPVVMMMACIILVGLSVTLMPNGSEWLNVLGFGGLILSIVIPLAYSMFMLPRWRIWAFTHVANVHELKRTAILARVYPKDDSFLWRIEIKSARQKQQLQELEQRFLEPEVFEDDLSIADHTEYCYPKADKWAFLLCSLAGLAGGLIMIDRQRLYPCIIMFLCSALFGAMAIKRFRSTEPQLTLSNEGIYSKKHGFHPWVDIENEKIYWVSAGKSSYYGLSYDVLGKHIDMSLRDIAGLGSYKIDHVMRTYRGRYMIQQYINQ